MTTITATRRVQFAIGHRVVRHESKCRNLHGHNYVFFLTAQATELDSVGRVIDFGVLKNLIGTWIESHWDHGFILFWDDAAGIACMHKFEEEERRVTASFMQKLFLLPTNPTAENMGLYLLHTVGPSLLPEGITLIKVVIHETENCIAEVTL